MPSLPPDGDPNGPGIIRDETGAQTLLGYVVDIREAGGVSRCWLDIGVQHGNRHGGLHGGIMSAMLDNAMGFAAARTGNDDGSTKVATLTMTTNYLAPARDGVVVATGEVSGGGRSTIFTEGRLEDENGTVLATATGVYKRVRT
ncbi:PaaI family thioesterase [uncultured Tateyamaria sp.]|uniref:PaaI family thioesterase n=1 Tax=uncultured Tateyamaria sp. TaxID=455651 RepID=UPI0026197BF4|nr:PaaI family thioesterase [uncultured Tateyamaria sp.]